MAETMDEEISQDTILFGKYQLGKLIGYGAFAKVYHARNVRTGQGVAIKAISKQKVVKGGLMSNIKREISIMRRLHHPNIVELYEVLASKTKIYFVMEYAKGGELFTKISNGRFSEELSRRYFEQLISAVGYCHSRGVYHRDLKPENLLLDENYNLKISDFGLSAVKDQIHHDGLLHTLCGTPAYVAPELLVKKGYNGAKLDIWSCGVILFVLNAGYLPFNDYSLIVMYRKIYKGEFRCPKWTSLALNRFLHRLLDTNPFTRITIDEIANDPWFKQGRRREMNFDFHDFDFDLEDFGNKDNKTFLNAFDIISFSSGFNLSGMFSDYNDILDSGERFISAEQPEKILQRVEEVAKVEDERMEITKKEWGAKLEGYNGNFVLIVEIYRLTRNLVVVETSKREVGSSRGFWNGKLRPKLSGLIYQPLDASVIKTSQ